MDSLRDIATSKWLLIAIATAVTKGIFQIRKRDFNILVFFCDLLLAIPVGYVWWEMWTATNANEWFLIISTVIMSGNAFTILLFIFNPETAKRMLSRWVIVNEIEEEKQQEINPK